MLLCINRTFIPGEKEEILKISSDGHHKDHLCRGVSENMTTTLLLVFANIERKKSNEHVSCSADPRPCSPNRLPLGQIICRTTKPALGFWLHTDLQGSAASRSWWRTLHEPVDTANNKLLVIETPGLQQFLIFSFLFPMRTMLSAGEILKRRGSTKYMVITMGIQYRNSSFIKS